MIPFSKRQFITDINKEEKELMSLYHRYNDPGDNDINFIELVLERYSNLKCDEYGEFVVSSTLSQPKFDTLRILMCLSANTEQLDAIIRFGLSRLIEDFQNMSSGIYQLIKPQQFTFGDVFSSMYDLSSVCRAVVSFIYYLNYLEFGYQAQKLQDFQIEIYNECVVLVYSLMDLHPEYFQNIPVDDFVSGILKCIYNDAICGENGTEIFLDTLVGNVNSDDWYFNGAQVYDDFISNLDVFCWNVIKKFDTEFSYSPFRLGVYMNFKIFTLQHKETYVNKYATAPVEEVE